VKDMDKSDNSLDITLGKRLRTLREGKKLKIVDMAQITGLTSSFISQVERDLVSPSIETLKKIGDALDTPLSYLFESYSSSGINFDIETDAEAPNQNKDRINRSSPVVHIHQRKMLSPQPGVNLHLLNPDMSGPIEFIYNVYEPGAGTGEGLYCHKGVECGLVLEGELLVMISDKKYLLRKGDSITFSSEEPHSKRNAGNVKCICIWANTPPWF